MRDDPPVVINESDEEDEKPEPRTPIKNLDQQKTEEVYSVEEE